jgi:hypothetical protein
MKNMNVKAVIAGLLILCTLSGFAQVSAEWQWASRAGGTGGTGGGDVDDQARDIAVDNEGNTYVVGNIYQSGFATFDTTSVPTYGDRDIFIAKYNCEGKLEWVKTGGNRIGDASNQFIEIDTIRKKIYYIGTLSSHALLSFTFANDTVIIDENNSLFIWELEYDGTLNWMFNSTTFGLPLETDIDKNGNIYVAFSVGDSSVFAPGFPISGGWHYAVLDSNGTAKQVTRIAEWIPPGPSNDVNVRDIKIDEELNVYIAGSYRDTVMIAGQQLISNGIVDGFILKHDATGNFEWIKVIPAQTNQGVGVSRLAILSEDNFYAIAGSSGPLTVGSITFNPSVGSSGVSAVFRYKNGLPVWGEKIDSYPSPFIRHLALDADQNLYISGGFHRSATIAGLTVTDIGSGPAHESFIAKFDTLNSIQYAIALPGKGDDFINAMTVGHNGNVYVAGAFGIDLQLPNDTIFTNGGVTDIFVAKFGIPQCADTTSPWIGIADVLGVENQHLLLYPNPTGGQFTIEADLNSSGGMLAVYNSLGQLVYQKRLHQSKGLYKDTIDLDVEHGIYFVQLDAGAERYSQKLIIR